MWLELRAVVERLGFRRLGVREGELRRVALGFGRIVVSEIEVPYMLVNLV